MSPKIGRIDLWNSCQFDPGRRGWVEYYKEVEGVEFLIQSQNPPPSVYRISCSNSIWNRKWFLKTLERGWSPGDWETKANDGRNNNDGFDVLSTIDRWTPTVVHSLCKHWRGKINLYGMLEHDREKIYDMSNEEEKGMLCDITTAVTAVNIDYMDPIRRKKKNIMDMECFQPNGTRVNSCAGYALATNRGKSTTQLSNQSFLKVCHSGSAGQKIWSRVMLSGEDHLSNPSMGFKGSRIKKYPGKLNFV